MTSRISTTSISRKIASKEGAEVGGRHGGGGDPASCTSFLQPALWKQRNFERHSGVAASPLFHQTVAGNEVKLCRYSRRWIETLILEESVGPCLLQTVSRGTTRLAASSRCFQEVHFHLCARLPSRRAPPVRAASCLPTRDLPRDTV